jgi:hypothetical protein
MPAENMTEAGAPVAPLTDDTTSTAGESIVDRLTGSGVEVDEPPLPQVKEPAWPGPDADAVPPAMSVPPATPVPPDKQETAEPGGPVDVAEPDSPVDVAEPASPADSVGTPGVEDTAGSVTVPSVGTPPPDDSVEAADPADPAPDVAAGEPPVDEPEESVEVSGSGGTMAAPAKQADGWQIDRYQLRSFTDAVVRTRSYLDSVQAKVDRMQGAELTPQIGTSPVGQQLAKKFDDRLNSADGLRAMLTEAMKRMDDFVASAEAAARAYDEVEEDTVDTVNAGDKVDAPQGKRG